MAETSAAVAIAPLAICRTALSLRALFSAGRRRLLDIRLIKEMGIWRGWAFDDIKRDCFFAVAEPVAGLKFEEGAKRGESDR